MLLTAVVLPDPTAGSDGRRQLPHLRGDRNEVKDQRISTGIAVGRLRHYTFRDL